MTYRKLFGLATLLACGASIPARAGVVGVSGAVLNLSFTPFFLDLGQLESDTAIFLITERTNVALGGNLAVDMSLPSTVPSATSLNLTPGLVPLGTRVDSYLLHFDVVGVPPNPPPLSGSVTFSAPVLGIEVLTTPLNGTDAVFGIPGAFYGIGEVNRGLELSPGLAGFQSFDGITLSSDRKTVSVILSTRLSLDDIRIVTAVPEPATSVLLALGGLAIVMYQVRTRWHHY